MENFIETLGEYLERGYKIDWITKKIQKCLNNRDVLLSIFPSDIVYLIRSYCDRSYLLLPTKMAIGSDVSYYNLNNKEKNEIFRTLTILLVNNAVDPKEFDIINNFFNDYYLELKYRDLSTTKKILENYQDTICWNRYCNFSNIITLEEKTLFEQYRYCLNDPDYYTYKFPWEW